MKTTELPLLEQIEAFTPPPARKPYNKLNTAIDRVRGHICGLFGVKADVVSDVEVAAFLNKVGADYVFPNIRGIGFQTEEELIKWAKRQK